MGLNKARRAAQSIAHHIRDHGQGRCRTNADNSSNGQAWHKAAKVGCKDAQQPADDCVENKRYRVHGKSLACVLPPSLGGWHKSGIEKPIAHLVNQLLGLSDRGVVGPLQIIQRIGADQGVGFGFAADLFLDQRTYTVS